MTRKKSKGSSGRDPSAALAAIDHTNQVGIHGLLDDGFVAARLAAQDKQLFNGQVLSADETIAQFICLPMPALAPRFLLQSEGWPLSRFVLVDGFEESCKSAFLNEVGVWHRRAGGHYVIIEAEGKDGAPLRDSFFNYDRQAWHYTGVATQEDWNKAFFHWIGVVRTLMDGGRHELTTKEYEAALADAKKRGLKRDPAKSVEVAGIGRIAPVAIGVDSLSAVTLAEFAEETIADGSPSQHHPVQAKRLSDFMKVGPKQLFGFPITFMAVSHLRLKKIEGTHATERSTAGGAAPKYQMSLEIEMKRMKKDQQTRPNKDYGEVHSIPLTMHVRKNSNAGHEHINVEMAWIFDPNYRDPITQEKRQRTCFDWHSSSIELLADCAKTGDAGQGFTSGRAKDLKKLVDLTVDVDSRVAWSETLGVDKEPYFKAGKRLEERIQADADFRRNLYEIMGIRQHRMFKSGVCMKKQVADYTVELVAADRATADRLKNETTDVVPVSETPPAAEPPA